MKNGYRQVDVSGKEVKELLSNGLCFPLSGAWLPAEGKGH